MSWTRRKLLCSPVAAWAAAAVGASVILGSARPLHRVISERGTLHVPSPASRTGLVKPPLVRVGILRETPETVSIDAPHGLRVLARGRRHLRRHWRMLTRATFAPSLNGGGEVRLLETGEVLEGATAAPARSDSVLAVGGRTYRGVLEVRPGARGTLTVVNVVNLEQYLRGVVPNELSPWIFPEIEALKAQAVAARTWVLAHRDPDEGYDVCATSACQAYRGRASEEPLTDRAVQETRGIVATWNGRPIRAFYTSTCGGHTEDGQAMLLDPAPYLRGVACAAACEGLHLHGEGGSVICLEPDAGGRRAASWAKRHDRWKTQLAPKTVARRVARYGVVGRVRDLVPLERGVSGRVVKLEVEGTEDDLQLKGLRIRRGLGLQENPLAIERERGDEGDVERFVISGRGWGHGVGLCQIGAFEMAQEGAGYDEILHHYYTGIELSSMSDVS